MKKNKRKINTFKNWELARKSSSRISTFPHYQSFLENLNPEMDYKKIMKIFDALSDSIPFVKMSNYFDYGTIKDSRSNQLNSFQIRIGKRDYRYDVRHFLKIFEPTVFNYCGMIIINVDPNIKEYLINVEEGKIKVKIPYDISEKENPQKEILPASKEIIKKWIDLLEIEEGYKQRFFKWWMETGIFDKERYNNRFKYIEVALVEWMRVCDPKDAKEAYLKIKFKKDLDSTETEILNHIETGIKEFNIGDFSDLQKGSSTLKRFGIDD